MREKERSLYLRISNIWMKKKKREVVKSKWKIFENQIESKARKLLILNNVKIENIM